MNKRIELKILLDGIQRLENEKKITMDPDLQSEIIRAVNTTRWHQRSYLLTREMRTAAYELKKDDNMMYHTESR